jgi:antirestriction protein
MTEAAIDISGYAYEDGNLNPSHDYLVPSVLKILVVSHQYLDSHSYARHFLCSISCARTERAGFVFNFSLIQS